ELGANIHLLQLDPPSRMISDWAVQLRALDLATARSRYVEFADHLCGLLTAYFSCEAASIHLFHGPLCFPKRGERPDHPRVLCTVASYGLPCALLQPERFRCDAPNRGLAGLVVESGGVIVVDLEFDDERRNLVRRPNHENLKLNSRFSAFRNT